MTRAAALVPRGLDPVLRQTYRPGEKLFLDYAGDKVPVVDPTTGETRRAEIFVAVLGFSNYAYAKGPVVPGA